MKQRITIHPNASVAAFLPAYKNAKTIEARRALGNNVWLWPLKFYVETSKGGPQPVRLGHAAIHFLANTYATPEACLEDIQAGHLSATSSKVVLRGQYVERFGVQTFFLLCAWLGQRVPESAPDSPPPPVVAPPATATKAPRGPTKHHVHVRERLNDMCSELRRVNAQLTQLCRAWNAGPP